MIYARNPPVVPPGNKKRMNYEGGRQKKNSDSSFILPISSIKHPDSSMHNSFFLQLFWYNTNLNFKLEKEIDAVLS